MEKLKIKFLNWINPKPIFGLDAEYQEEEGNFVPVNTFRMLFGRAMSNFNDLEDEDSFGLLVLESLKLGLAATNFAYAANSGSERYYNEKRDKLIKACQQFLAKI